MKKQSLQIRLHWNDADHIIDGLFPAITSAKNDPGFARHNPDNYVYFALSYWFWQNKKYDAQGNTMDANSNQKGTKYNFANGKANAATVPP